MRSDIQIAGVESGEHLDAQDKNTSLARTLAELARIDRMHADAPQCWLCGQRTNTPDKFGLCSKITPDHIAERQRKDTA